MTGPQSIEAPAYVLTMTEAQFQDLVIGTARTFGWLVVHIRNTVANPVAMPDLLMWRNDQYLLAELKTMRGKVSPKQQGWHENAARHGVTVHLWRPDDWDERIVPILRDGPGADR